MTRLILVILILINVASGQVLVNKTCGSYNATDIYNFQLSKFVGKWYEIAKYGPSEKCATDYITPIHNTTLYNMTHSIKTNGQIKNKTIIIEQRNNFSNEIESKTHDNFTAPIKILATDYNDYAILWSCLTDYRNYISHQKLLILSKDSTKKLNDADEVTKVLNRTRILDDKILLNFVDHSSLSCNRMYNTTNTSIIHYPVHPHHPHTTGGGAIITIGLISFLMNLITRLA